MHVIILALLSYVAFGLSPAALRNENLNEELKQKNRLLKQTLRQLEVAVGRDWVHDCTDEMKAVGCKQYYIYRVGNVCYCDNDDTDWGFDEYVERAVGGTCDHITEDNKSYSCNVYYKKIAKCPICQDDNAGAVDNSGITSNIGSRSREIAVGDSCYDHADEETCYDEGCEWDAGNCIPEMSARAARKSKEASVGSEDYEENVCENRGYNSCVNQFWAECEWFNYDCHPRSENQLASSYKASQGEEESLQSYSFLNLVSKKAFAQLTILMASIGAVSIIYYAIKLVCFYSETKFIPIADLEV